MSEPPRLVASEGKSLLADPPPNLIDSIKDDLGIPASDTTQDAWLNRRIANIWARFEKYCCRALPVPPAKFIDDWGLIAERSNYVEPRAIDHWPIGSPFLRNCPVATIEAIEISGSPGVAANVLFEAATGKIFSIDGVWSHDVAPRLRQGEVKITYTAGWLQCPGDLYEALLGSIAPLWQSRSFGGAAGGGGGTGGLGGARINIVDVGEIELAANSAFVSSAITSAASADPLVGPWITILNSYMDVRVQMGSPLIPVTTAL